MNRRPDLEKLIDFNVDVLNQGLQVLKAQEAVPGSDYSSHIGPHLRHVIEHYEAFTQLLPSHCVDYDSRARDRAPERDPKVARSRIEALKQQLQILDVDAVSEPITVHMRGGISGQENFASSSTLARELLFVASHAVHHYALIQMYCRTQGIHLGEDFGKAPATLHHARAA